MNTTSAAGPAIELQGLIKQFGSFTAVNDLSVSVDRAESSDCSAQWSRQ